MYGFYFTESRLYMRVELRKTGVHLMRSFYARFYKNKSGYAAATLVASLLRRNLYFQIHKQQLSTQGAAYGDSIYPLLFRIPYYLKHSWRHFIQLLFYRIQFYLQRLDLFFASTFVW